MLSLGAIVAALVSCLYFFKLPPFNAAKSADKPSPAAGPSSKTSAGFGRRSK
jgi:hypothetical protein